MRRLMVRPPSRHSNRPYFIASLLAIAVIVAAWVGRDLVPTVGPGDRAPDFEAVWLDGRPASLADFEGKVVLLNIWATWCPPCVEELPAMQRLYEVLKDEGLELVAVSVDARLGEVDTGGRPGGDVGAFVARMGLTFPILHDPRGRIQGTYLTTGIPESFIIGRDGIIYHKASGPREWDQDEWVAEIRRILAEGS